MSLQALEGPLTTKERLLTCREHLIRIRKRRKNLHWKVRWFSFHTKISYQSSTQWGSKLQTSPYGIQMVDTSL